MEPNLDYLQMLEIEIATRLSRGDGPQKVIPPDLITALTGILTSFIQGCLNNGQTESAVVERVQKPGSYERAAFRQRFIYEEFNGSGKAYRKAGGDKLLDEYFAIHKDATPEQVTGLVKQVASNRFNHSMI